MTTRQKSTNNNGQEEDDDQQNNENKRKYRETLDALHEEMELVQPAIGKRGQRQRKLPKAQSKERTKRLRKLEKKDTWNSVEGGVAIEKPIRGAMAAAEDRVVEKSLIFAAKKDNDDDESASDNAADNEESDEEEPSQSDRKPAAKSKKARREPKPVLSVKKRKQLRLMKNFRSSKLAERHGDALGAHAQGKPGLAIRKLKKVAIKAPSAPQVYSSLGMVYESMLLESQRKGVGASLEVGSEESNNDHRKDPPRQSRVSFADDVEHPVAKQDKALTEQLNLAKKAYGSYHVAAILCKRDYTLWSRAGEAAYEVATLHSSIMKLPGLTSEVTEYHRGEKQRWLEEARNDYNAADHMHPPGIDIPARLAHVMMELGMLSEALTLLTDLKDKPEFGVSYRAWLLYSDLMLRIGYECNKWNKGSRNNSNAMFRRWLRKLSTKFDWEERRTQGLVKALEAACGSKSCHEVIAWLKQRVARDADATMVESNGKESAEKADEANELAHEKEILRQRQETELASFDKTTQELNLEVDSVAEMERKISRNELLDSQRDAMKRIGERDTDVQSPNIENRTEQAVVEDSAEDDLVLSASYKVVFAIASELMRHLLDLGLFSGGKLVGEAVSKYLKERAYLWEKRKQARSQRRVQAATVGLDTILQQNQSLNTGPSDSGTDSDMPLSDEEELDNIANDSVLASLMRGTLPPDIRSLYGIALACTGDNLHLAYACIRSINEMPRPTISWLTDKIVDTNIPKDETWFLLRELTMDLFNTMSALAFVADTVPTSEKKVLAKLHELFRAHVNEMEQMGLIEAVRSQYGRADSTTAIYRRDQVIKVLLAEASCKVHKAELSLETQSEQEMKDCGDVILETLDSFNTLLGVVWAVDDDASISVTSKRIVSGLSASFRIVCRLLSAGQAGIDGWRSEFVKQAAYRMVMSVAKLSNAPDLSIQDEASGPTEALCSIPLSSEWLSSELLSVSRLALNLCVASNVTKFSGWSPREFSLSVTRSDMRNYLNVISEDGKVAGCISRENEQEIVDQWDMLMSRNKGLLLDFREKMAAIRETHWYNTSRTRFENTRNASFEEDSAVAALLCVSRCCFSLADDKGLPLGLSVLLPISQFCSKHVLWEARIGRLPSYEIRDKLASTTQTARVKQPDKRASTNSKSNEKNAQNSDEVPVQKSDQSSEQGKRAASLAGTNRAISNVDLRNKSREVGLSKAAGQSVEDVDALCPSQRPGYMRRSQRVTLKAKLEKPGEQIALHQPFSFESCTYDDADRISLACNLKLAPIKTVQNAWQASKVEAVSNGDQFFWEEDMNSLDDAMRKLRLCFSSEAVAKAALHVSSCLLKVAASPIAANPFVCIQQAALFASQATKGGTSDHIYQAPIPHPDACTAQEGLVIVGRADCLHAVDFLHEAAFLCNYVAKVCSVRRDPTVETCEWNDQWKVVSMLNYDVSIRIRMAIRLRMDQQLWKKEEADKWDSEAVFEFHSARKDELLSNPKRSFPETSVEERTIDEDSSAMAVEHTDPERQENATLNMDDHPREGATCDNSLDAELNMQITAPPDDESMDETQVMVAV